MAKFRVNYDTGIWTYTDEKKTVLYDNVTKGIVKQVLDLSDEFKVVKKAVKTMFNTDYKSVMRGDYNQAVSHPNLKEVDMNPLTMAGLIFGYNNNSAKKLMQSGSRFDLPEFYTNLEFMCLTLNDEANQSHFVQTTNFKSNKDFWKFDKAVEDTVTTRYMHRYK